MTCPDVPFAVCGEEFDSVEQFGRWADLKKLEEMGLVADLKRNVKYRNFGESQIHTADVRYKKHGFTLYEKNGNLIFDRGIVEVEE